MLALRRRVASRSSGRDDLDAVHLHDAGQRVDELLDDLAVTAILHEVGYALRRTGNLNGNALLVRDKTDDDALTSLGPTFATNSASQPSRPLRDRATDSPEERGP